MTQSFHAWIVVTTNPVADLSLAAANFDRSIDADPAIFTITPDEGERTIKIKRIRQLHQELASHSVSSRERMILLAPAEAISLPGQQALLKLLEEPPENSVIVLVSASAASLPATIRSRCREVQLVGRASEVGLLAKLAEADSLAKRMTVLADLPRDRDELKRVLQSELSSPASGDKLVIELKLKMLQAYDGLQSNVSVPLALSRLIS